MDQLRECQATCTLSREMFLSRVEPEYGVPGPRFRVEIRSALDCAPSVWLRRSRMVERGSDGAGSSCGHQTVFEQCV